MYAIVQTGGKQYMVQKGDVLKVEKLNQEVGDVVDFDCLCISDGGNLNTETSKSKVSAKVLNHGRGKKVRVFKYKSKKNYRKRKGHRQPFTEVEITDIQA